MPGMENPDWLNMAGDAHQHRHTRSKTPWR